MPIKNVYCDGKLAFFDTTLQSALLEPVLSPGSPANVGNDLGLSFFRLSGMLMQSLQETDM